jgi:fermentation-respiration switch protein FrsA (DUF1100 family)
VDVLGEWRLRRELDDLLGDRGRVIADPFELVGDMVKGEQVTQVARHRLLGRDRDRDEPRHLSLGVVDAGVGLDDLHGEGGVVRGQRSTRTPDGVLHCRAHAQDGVLDALFLTVQGLSRGAGQVLRLAGPLRALKDAFHLRVHRRYVAGPVLIGHPLVLAQPNRPET